MISGTTEEGDAGLNSIESEFDEAVFSVHSMKDEFHYSDKMTQVASIALEDMHKRMNDDETYLLKTEIPKRFFPVGMRTSWNVKKWPTVNAGFDVKLRVKMRFKSNNPITQLKPTYKEITVPVFNTLGFWGLRLSGNQMMEFGAYLLTHHRELMIKLYDDKGLYVVLPDKDDPAIQQEANKVGGIRGTRAGWHYSCFWWIPQFKDYPEENAKYKWIAAIGHQGQFILLELTQGWVFIRQRFSINASFQNADIEHITSSASDTIRYPSFCFDAFMLVININKNQIK
jgi:hypothetical protein